MFYEEKRPWRTNIVIVDDDGYEVLHNFEEGDRLVLLDKPVDLPFNYRGKQTVMHSTGVAVYSKQYGWQNEYYCPEAED